MRNRVAGPGAPPLAQELQPRQVLPVVAVTVVVAAAATGMT
jgi:hypothetical protein